MGIPPVASAFERALAAEILASEQLRVRVLAATLPVLLAVAAQGSSRPSAIPLGDLPIKGYEGAVRVWRLE